MKSLHIHSYDSIKVVKVIADNPKYSIDKHGTWAFLTKYCSCGDEKNVDYLPRKVAEEKLELLLERG
jgi:hypothetical protein